MRRTANTYLVFAWKYKGVKGKKHPTSKENIKRRQLIKELDELIEKESQ